MTALSLAPQRPARTARSFPDFLESLRDPATPTLSPRRYSDALHIDLQILADLAKVHRNTLARAPASSSVQAYLRAAVRVIKAAADLHGDVDQALFWFRNDPLAPFDYLTAERLVADGRADDVVRYLDSLHAGAAG